MRDDQDDGVTEIEEDKIDNEKVESRDKELKSWKKRTRTKSSGRKKDRTEQKEVKEQKEKEPKNPPRKKTKEAKSTMEKKEDPKTPVATDRPVREKKSVERLLTTIEKEPAKEFWVEKGRGTALKDIPNVAYKLSRKKIDDAIKLLHTILFGRRAKAAELKNNILSFSGLVCHDSEEKQLIKLKEKLDKCAREKLVKFCDILDLSTPKANTRKEDIIARLIEFLVEPQATTSELLAEKAQSSKAKKRKRVEKSASESETPAKDSSKIRKKTESTSKNGGKTKSILPEPEDESEEDINGDSERESDDEERKMKGESTKFSAKKGSTGKAKPKKVTPSKKSSPPPKKIPAKSQPSSSKTKNVTSTKKSSGKKKDESTKKLSTPMKTTSKESTGKKGLKLNSKPKEVKLSDNQLTNAIRQILKEVNFNTATINDILKLLAKQFNTDLSPRKSSIKNMIQHELTNLGDADEADEPFKCTLFQEKQLIKLKEKLDKCVKEKLVELCDVFDIPAPKAKTRKEDIILKLIDFLVEPHANTSELLTEKSESSKGKKRKRVEKSASGSETQAKGSAKIRKKTESTSKKRGETKSTVPESEEEEAHEKENINGVPERTEYEMPERAETEEKENVSEGDKRKVNRESAKSSAKKGSAGKAKTKKVTISKKVIPPPKTIPAKSPPTPSKTKNDGSEKKSSGKKKGESTKKLSTSRKTTSKESTVEPFCRSPPIVTLKLKNNNPDELKLSDNDLKNAIHQILKEADLNKATFNDILKLLAERFGSNLTPKKSSIKIMIQDELAKLADADEADNEKDENNPRNESVEA